MTTPNIDLAKLVRKICPIMTVQVWGSDECILRKARDYRDEDIEKVIAQMLKLVEENERLRLFTEHALDLCSWDNDPDGGSIQDRAEDLKLIELRPIDPEDAIMDETEQYFCAWTPKAARKGDGDENDNSIS